MIKKNVDSNVSSEAQVASSAHADVHHAWEQVVRRRSFLKSAGMSSTALSSGVLLLPGAKQSVTASPRATLRSYGFLLRPS